MLSVSHYETVEVDTIKIPSFLRVARQSVGLPPATSTPESSALAVGERFQSG